MGSGGFIGVIIGITGGIAALMLIKTLNSPSKKATTTIALIGELVSLGLCMVKGEWASSKLFEIMNMDFSADQYYPALAISFILIIIYPVSRLIIRLGEQFGRGAD